MSLENVREIITNLKIKKVHLVEDMVEASALNPCASEEEIKSAERNCGIIFPDSYKFFLREYANGGFFLLGAEPLMGVGHKVSPSLSKIKNSSFILMEKKQEKDCYIFPQKRSVLLKQLVPFTYGNSLEISNDHWAFLCDKKYPCNDYPVAYVSREEEDVICMLDNFEKWLEIFWRGNADRKGCDPYLPVINFLYPNWKERIDLLDADRSELMDIYDRIRKENDANFKKYGVNG